MAVNRKKSFLPIPLVLVLFASGILNSNANNQFQRNETSKASQEDACLNFSPAKSLSEMDADTIISNSSNNHPKSSKSVEKTSGEAESSLQESDSSSASYQHMLFMGTGFGNDLLFDATSLSSNQPFISADISYVYKGKWSASIAAYNMPQREILIPMVDFSLGFSHVFNDKFDVAVAISSYQTATAVKDELHDSFSFFRIRGGYDWYWLYTRLSAGSIIGPEAGLYLYLRNSRYFRSGDLGKSGNHFSFDPNINMVFGNRIEYIELESTPINRPGRSPGNTNITYDQQNNFSALKMEFSIPTSFYFYDLTLEAEPLYLIPINKKETEGSAGGFYFFLNLYYRIF
jgi:hypothetical protein